MKNTPPRSQGARSESARHSSLSRHVLLPAQRFLHDESVSGVVLLVAAALALGWANSPWGESYEWLFHLSLTVQVGDFRIGQDLQHWINDGLMAIFFFLVSLEIKREILHGELAGARKAALPIAAALGGMGVPVGIFLAFNLGGEGARGWGIPMATDIAFAAGVLAVLGRRVPAELRLFLLAFAIVDDIGSILVIAVYYTEHFSLTASLAALGCLGLIGAMRWLGFWQPGLYLVPALVFWAAMLKSGVHATIAGVILGALTPARSPVDSKDIVANLQEPLDHLRQGGDHDRTQAWLGRAEEMLRQSESPLERIERLIRPWVSFFVLPIFALANAGVVISGELLVKALSSPVTQGIVLGLVVGKALGVTGAAWLAVRAGIAVLPRNVQWRHILGAAIIGGIGFTVSLFISDLAYGGERQAAEAKIGILVASAVAAIGGYLFLRLQREPKNVA